MKTRILIAGLILLSRFPLWAQTSVITQIELTKQSRGYQEAIRIRPDSAFVVAEDLKNSKPAERYSKAISEDEWTALVNALGSVKLKDIESLPSPTMKRASDAAMHSTIKIITNEGSEYAHGYDDENPHEALQPFRKKIREVSGKTE